MTPQAMGKARTIPSELHERILSLRKAGKTVAEICMALKIEGNSKMASVQDLLHRQFGNRDLRGPDIGHQSGKTKSFRRAMAE